MENSLNNDNNRTLQKENTVVQSNEFILNFTEYISKLPLPSAKLVDIIISTIKPTDTKFYNVRLSINHLQDILHLNGGGNNRKMLLKYIEKLNDNGIDFSNTSNYETRWLLTKASIDKVGHGKSVNLQINPELSSYLLELKDKGNFTSYNLKEIVSLKSKYSLAIYKLVKQADKGHGVAKVSLPVDRWKVMLNAPKKYRVNDLKRYAFQKAIDEINNNDLIKDIELKMEVKKEGRFIKSIAIENVLASGLKKKNTDAKEGFNITRQEQRQIDLYNLLNADAHLKTKNQIGSFLSLVRTNSESDIKKALFEMSNYKDTRGNVSYLRKIIEDKKQSSKKNVKETLPDWAKNNPTKKSTPVSEEKKIDINRKLKELNKSNKD